MQLYYKYARAGFSMVELLVVIAIIAVLVAMTVGVVRTVVANQQRANTDATMRTVHAVLQQHWAQVINDARKEIPPSVVKDLAGGDPIRAQVIWIKFRLMEAFPESYSEVYAPPFASYMPATLSKYTASYKRTLGGASATDGQAAACLLMSLSLRRGGSGLNVSNLGPNVKDTDGDGHAEIVDGWSRPIDFKRFPKGPLCAELQLKNPARAGSKAAKFSDPLDPDGTLLNSSWFPTTARNLFESICAYDIESPIAGTANYILPVILSRGSNGVPGDFDDIPSFALKQD